MNCEKITYYIEKGHLTDLNISERVQVKLHKLICNCCKNYTPDSEMMNEILKMLGEEDDSPNLTDQEKQKIKDALLGLE